MPLIKTKKPRNRKCPRCGKVIVGTKDRTTIVGGNAGSGTYWHRSCWKEAEARLFRM